MSKPGINLQPTVLAPAWKRELWAERVSSARALLVIHGFLTEAEGEKVRDRIEKWWKANVCECAHAKHWGECSNWWCRCSVSDVTAIGTRRCDGATT